MKLSLLTDKAANNMNPDITGISIDSRTVQHGFLFAALPGTKNDGRDFIGEAIEKGAVAVLAPAGTKIENENIALINADNPRRDLSLFAARFYQKQPSYIAAVTGTNGKSSTVHFTRQLWEALDIKAASFGTTGIHARNVDRPGTLTTPDPVSLHRELAGLADAGITHLAIEASSHGLDQYRMDGLKISSAGFTSFSHDHLDYHKDMDSYLKAKSRLFGELLIPDGMAVLNADIPEYEELEKIVTGRNVRLLSYGENGTDIRLRKCEAKTNGQNLHLNICGHEYEVILPLVGSFQTMNALCSLGLTMAEDPDNAERTARLVQALSHLKGAPGRLQPVAGHPHGAVYVDYAHTPDALKNVLRALRLHTKNRLICLVGCGGDRDAAKRPVMGRICHEMADITVITDDNPRSEDPAAIRTAMITQAPEARNIGNRRKAIQWAVNEMKDGDVLVIAGKGHETGQVIGDKIEPFDDVEEAQKAIGALN